MVIRAVLALKVSTLPGSISVLMAACQEAGLVGQWVSPMGLGEDSETIWASRGCSCHHLLSASPQEGRRNEVLLSKVGAKAS